MVGLAATLNPMRSTSAGAAAGRDRSPLVGGNRTLRTLREGKIASSCIVNIARTARLEADSIMVSGKLELLGNGGVIGGGGSNNPPMVRFFDRFCEVLSDLPVEKPYDMLHYISLPSIV